MLLMENAIETINPLVSALEETFTVSNMIIFLAIGIGAAAGIVLAKWGIDSVINIIKNSLLIGNFNSRISFNKREIRQAVREVKQMAWEEDGVKISTREALDFLRQDEDDMFN